MVAIVIEAPHFDIVTVRLLVSLMSLKELLFAWRLVGLDIEHDGLRAAFAASHAAMRRVSHYFLLD